MENYQQQAIDFLTNVNATISINYHSCDLYFPNDKRPRNIYMVTIKRNGKKYSFKFGDSFFNTDKILQPTAYDVLSCLTKEDYADFDQFCSYFGYDTDSSRAEKIFKAVNREFKGVSRVFGDVLEQLQEIN